MTTPTAVTGLPRPRVVLVGPPGAGKSTIGRRLSHALSCELVDSDHLIEQAKDKPCGEVFSELGESDFRALEAEHVAAALRTGGVVSLGGGFHINGAQGTRNGRNRLHCRPHAQLLPSTSAPMCARFRRRAPQQVPRQASHPAGRPRARGPLRFRGSKRPCETSYDD